MSVEKLRSIQPDDENASASDASFRALADTLPIMVCQQDVSGQLVFANTKWYAVTGLPRDPSSFQPDAWYQVVHPDDNAVVFGALGVAIETQAAYSFDYRVRRAGDESLDAYRWYYARAEPQSRNGLFRGWFISVVDVQETRDREAAERELRLQATRRETEFKALGEAIPQIVWTADASGALDWYNHRWYDYTGQTQEEAAGWGWQAVHHPEDFPIMMQQWTEALKSQEKLEMQFRLRGRDGTFRWFLTLVNPVKDENGKVVRWFGTNTDINDQKQNIERSTRVAKTLQEVFLPERLPRSAALVFDALYVPAESDALVGGDWYDAFTLDDGTIVVSIGDVAGHGLDAAVIAGRLRQTIFTEGFANPDPARILEKTDRILRAQTDTIATAFVATIDPNSGVMWYSSAGHPQPVLISPGAKPIFMSDGSAPLGTGFTPRGLITETHAITIPPDSVIIFYTDGITEFTRDIIEGRRRLLAAAAEIATGDLPATAAAVHARVVGTRTTADDIAVLIAHFKPTAMPTQPSKPDLTKQWRFHSSHAYSAHAARQELMGFLRSHAIDRDNLFAAEAIIGELLANTVEHAPGMVEIEIDWSEASPILRMRDTGASLHDRGDATLPERDLDENGRGLFLIRQLSAQVTITPAPGFGNQFVIALPLHRS